MEKKTTTLGAILRLHKDVAREILLNDIEPEQATGLLAKIGYPDLSNIPFQNDYERLTLLLSICYTNNFNVRLVSWWDKYDPDSIVINLKTVA